MRYFGNFHCHRCKSSWQSGNAFKRHYQKCQQCKRRTYPNKLKPLAKDLGLHGGERSKPLPHQQELCQRCKKLGRSCENEPIGGKFTGNDHTCVSQYSKIQSISKNKLRQTNEEQTNKNHAIIEACFFLIRMCTICLFAGADTGVDELEAVAEDHDDNRAHF